MYTSEKCVAGQWHSLWWALTDSNIWYRQDTEYHKTSYLPKLNMVPTILIWLINTVTATKLQTCGNFSYFFLPSGSFRFHSLCADTLKKHEWCTDRTMRGQETAEGWNLLATNGRFVDSVYKSQQNSKMKLCIKRK